MSPPLDFSSLEKKAKTINQHSDQLTAYLEAINDKLNSLNLGIEVVCPNRFDWVEGEEESEIDSYLGYGKLQSTWGLLVRFVKTIPTGHDNQGEPLGWRTLDTRKLFLLSCSRQLRMKAVDEIQKLIKILETEAEKLGESVSKAKTIAEAL